MTEPRRWARNAAWTALTAVGLLAAAIWIGNARHAADRTPAKAPKPPRLGRWSTYMGRFSVPPWLFDASPKWLHEAADWLGGVETSPWVELRDKVRYSRPALLVYRMVKGRGRV